MSSRERVLAAFDHTEPDRVPAWCGASPEFWNHAKRELGLDDEGLRVRFGDDFRRVFATDDNPEYTLSDGAVSMLSDGVVYRTIFGIERSGIGYGQPLSHPLAQATLTEVHDYQWPDPLRMNVSGIRREVGCYGGQYAVLGGEWSPFWHDAIDLIGMENLYYRMYDDPAFVDAVMGHIVDYYAEVSRRIFDAAADVIDIFFIGNDLGSTNGPLLGEAMFRRFILPHIARLIDLGHSYGLKVMLHCCGGFAPLIPSLIEAGLDGLHAVQPSCHGMDLRTLKAEFGDRILFNGCIDSQSALIEGTTDHVRRKTREVIDIMKHGGGFVAGASHDYILEETPLENILAMFDTIREYGVYG